MKLHELAQLLDGEVAGSSEVEITGASGITDAKEGDITFLSSRKWLDALKNSRASAVLVQEFIEDIDTPQIKTRNPQYAFARLLSHFHVKPHPCKGVSTKATVAPSVLLGEKVTIYDYAYIAEGVTIGAGTVIYPGVFVGESSSIGEGCVLHPNVTVRERITIGNRVVIHAGSVIGSDGFGYVFAEGKHQKIPQVGDVVIEDEVEIGAAVTIDRATTGTTFIGGGTKIDNLVQIGHNVHIGRNVIIVAQVGIAGSSRIGDGVVLGGQVGVADHSVIEAGTMVGAKAGVLGHMKRGIYSGTMPMPHREWLKAMAVFAKLPEMKKKLEDLERKIAEEEK
ncbi:MAG: UDP-3-O-(3-hydroxymyristoyl)glucosamine N-acyltransferase [Alphaproteobacteria bacterium]|uniref:UDP-3-O-acylglucosamine N-acyltransferase n=1 Tax=Candidatus Nitrobium versatile TaxID=2884831 RepID=A0A953JE07_9BACT|nr:UDP-3-O-(3-hydroxymyristoyl)glucosamine N-acyltransferase [Candidatus Nitrobium versatile]